MKTWSKTEWRHYRNYLECISCTMEIGTIEHRNILRRAAWIDNNRL